MQFVVGEDRDTEGDGRGAWVDCPVIEGAPGGAGGGGGVVGPGGHIEVRDGREFGHWQAGGVGVVQSQGASSHGREHVVHGAVRRESDVADESLVGVAQQHLEPGRDRDRDRDKGGGE